MPYCVIAILCQVSSLYLRYGSKQFKTIGSPASHVFSFDGNFSEKALDTAKVPLYYLMSLESECLLVFMVSGWEKAGIAQHFTD